MLALRVIEVRQVKSVPYIPISHPFVERLIGSVRRVHLDRMFFWNAVDLARKLGEFTTYYNCNRCHQSLRRGTPLGQSGKLAPRRASLRTPRRYPGPDRDRRCHFREARRAVDPLIRHRDTSLKGNFNLLT